MPWPNIVAFLSIASWHDKTENTRFLVRVNALRFWNVWPLCLSVSKLQVNNQASISRIENRFEPVTKCLIFFREIAKNQREHLIVVWPQEPPRCALFTVVNLVKCCCRSFWRRTSARNVSFSISLRWQIYFNLSTQLMKLNFVQYLAWMCQGSPVVHYLIFLSFLSVASVIAITFNRSGVNTIDFKVATENNWWSSAYKNYLQ